MHNGARSIYSITVIIRAHYLRHVIRNPVLEFWHKPSSQNYDYKKCLLLFFSRDIVNFRDAVCVASASRLIPSKGAFPDVPCDDVNYLVPRTSTLR